MSIIHFDTVTAASVDQIVVNLAGGFASDYDAFNARAGFELRPNGYIYKYLGFSYLQTSSDTDWITPRTLFDPADYEARAKQLPGGIFLVGDAVDTWLPLSTNRLWFASCLRFCVQTGSFHLDIRYQNGSDPRNTVSSLNDGAPCMATNIYDIYLESN